MNATELRAQSDFCKNIPDSLIRMNYKELSKQFHKNRKDKKLSFLIASAYLNKGKFDRNKLKIAQGYHFMSFLYEEDNKALIYLDSSIYITKDIEYSEYPTICYLLKGDYFFKKRNFKKTLDNYLLGIKHSKLSNLKDLEYKINFNIAVLKLRIGDLAEAEKIFSKCKSFYLSKNDYQNYLISLFALSDVKIRLKKFAEASSINISAYAFSRKQKDKVMLNYFVLEEGVNYYWKKEYRISSDSINKVVPFLNSSKDLPNLAMAYFYLGMNEYGRKNKLKAIEYFKKVDIIFNQINDLHPDIRKGYELLINYYKSNKNLVCQLYYIEQLVKLDEILNNNYKYLSRRINVEYDTPRLLNEKQNVITELKNKESYSTILLIIACLVLIFLVIIAFYYNKRQKQFKSNFEKLLREIESNNGEYQKPFKIKDNVPLTKEIIPLDIFEHIVVDIEQKLLSFEEEQGFLLKDCTLKYLSEQFGTNTNYLSKIINAKKGVGFPVYINNLRIDFVVKELQKNKKFRMYTIKAIAETAGFNTAETFSKAFLSSTGVHPSFFIKELNNSNL